VCQKTGSVPCRWQCHSDSLTKRVFSPRLISQQINKFGPFGNTWRSGTRDAFLKVEAANRLVVQGNTTNRREKRVMGMLRITIAETLTEQRWTLEGRLVHPWVSELKSSWTRTETARRERRCVVDLTEVTFIDKSGEKVLAELCREGAEFVATGVYTQHVVDNIERKKSNRQL
jgi:hypothetical protein